MFPSVLKGALIGLAAGIILAVVLGRFGLFRRQNRVHSALAKLWYAYIPLLFAVTFAAWSGISYGHSMIRGLADEMRPEVTAVSVEFAEGFLEELGAISGDIQVAHVISLVGTYIDDYFGTSVLSGIASRSGYARRVVGAIRPYVVNSLTDYAANRIASAAAGRLNLPEERIAELWNTDILTAFKSGLVMDIIEAQAEARIAPAYKTVKIAFIVLAAVPAAEIGISLRRGRRGRSKAAR
jgi:hypothetical protein